MNARIVTLAQLALMPIGTRVSPLLIEEGHLVFDCQGVVQVLPSGKVTQITEHWLELTEDLMEVLIYDGRVETREASCTYTLPGFYPHRFVVLQEGVTQ